MAAYVKQSDQVVVILSKAEAHALRDMALKGVECFEDAPDEDDRNHQTVGAGGKALRALEIACENGSRSGAAIY